VGDSDGSSIPVAEGLCVDVRDSGAFAGGATDDGGNGGALSIGAGRSTGRLGGGGDGLSSALAILASDGG